MIAPVVIFAVGNPSRGDDAIGPECYGRLEKMAKTENLADRFELIEDFQLNIEHALDLEGRELALFIDAGENTPAPFIFAQIYPSTATAHTTHALPPEAVLQVYRQMEDKEPPPSFVLCVRGEGFELAIVAMFQNEWRLQGKTASLRSIAIIDTQPEQQYLYPEFVLAKAMLERHGIDVRICDPAELTLSDGSVRAGGRNIDLVYNRLVDFTFGTPAHDVLRRAYAAGAVVVTPGPHTHALLANKRNLVMLSDLEALRRIGADQADIAALSTVPRTEEVTLESAPRLWSERKRLFFKPLSGHGGKAVYRGDKLTKSTWAEITKGDYIAQELVAPGQRMVEVDHAQQSRKMDVRLYTYDGKLLVAAARLYQGQTTNFRTLGGGFAPVFIV